MVFETVIPPNDGPGSFSTMKQVMPSGVRAASATTLDRSPLVTHIFVPSRMYSSPSGVALHCSAWVSLPASGSLNDSAPRLSPVAITGSRRAFCSSVPCSFSKVAAMVWVLRMPVSDIHP
jgi:hypothetical protein